MPGNDDKDVNSSGAGEETKEKADGLFWGRFKERHCHEIGLHSEGFQT